MAAPTVTTHSLPARRPPRPPHTHTTLLPRDMHVGVTILRNALIGVLEQVLSVELAGCVGFCNVSGVLEDLNDMAETQRKQRRQELKRAHQREVKAARARGLVEPETPDFEGLALGQPEPMLEVVRRAVSETRMSLDAALSLLRTVARDDQERQQCLCVEGLLYGGV